MRKFYERELGWPTVGNDPLDLITGVLFDVLEVPARAGRGVMDRFPRTGPVALYGERMSFLVAVDCAEELPGLLDWLEWNGVPLDLTASGPGGRLRAPAPVHTSGHRAAAPSPDPRTRPIPREAVYDRTVPVWLRPPEPDFESETSLPSMEIAGGQGSDRPVGLVALVTALANNCHRIRLSENQPWAFSYASRIVAGTRPRSLTS